MNHFEVRGDELHCENVPLSRIAAEAAAEAATQPMPATTACLRAQRLAAFLPDLQAPPPPATAAVTLFDPPP